MPFSPTVKIAAGLVLTSARKRGWVSRLNLRLRTSPARIAQDTPCQRRFGSRARSMEGIRGAGNLPIGAALSVKASSGAILRELQNLWEDNG